MLYNLCMAETFFCLIYSHWKKKSILFILYVFYFMEAPSLEVLKATLDRALGSLI